MKEVHALCLQLQRIVKEDLLMAKNEQVTALDFNTGSFKWPTKQETSTLQQVLIAGLTENLCRIAPLFDANGNELPPSNKASKVVYESQET